MVIISKRTSTPNLFTVTYSSITFTKRCICFSFTKSCGLPKSTVNLVFTSTIDGKVISEEIVDIEFEGTETKAKKVLYDFTGMTSVLASMSGGETWTIYYVATEVRGNDISCVLSFWNNDTITENRLAPLLEEVMKLKN